MTGGEKAAIGWRFISQTLFLVRCEAGAFALSRAVRDLRSIIEEENLPAFTVYRKRKTGITTARQIVITKA